MVNRSIKAATHLQKRFKKSLKNALGEEDVNQT